MGSTVRVRSLWGEETFKCIEGKTPSGMIFIPYGTANLPFDGTIHGRNGHAPVQGVGGRGGAVSGATVGLRAGRDRGSRG